MNRRGNAKISLEMIVLLCILAGLLIILSVLKATLLAAILLVSVTIVILALLDFNSKVKLDGDSVQVETCKNRKNSSPPDRNDE